MREKLEPIKNMCHKHIKHLLTVVHTNAHPTLIVRGSLRLSVYKGSSGSVMAVGGGTMAGGTAAMTGKGKELP
jgi:hypothetical protein